MTKTLSSLLGSEQKAYLALALILAFLMLFFQFIMLALVQEEKRDLDQEERTPLKEIFQVIFRNDQLLWTSISMSLFMIGYTTTTSFGLYYFEYIFGNKEMYSSFALVLGISQILALIIFPLLSRYFKRKQLYFAGTVLVILGYLIFFLAQESMLTVGLAGASLFIGQAFIQLIMLMFIADCVEYGEYKLGRRNDSITLSLQPFINKVGAAIASGIVGITIVVSGVKEASSALDMSQSGKLIFKSAMLILPLILILIAYLIYRKKYKIDEEKYQEILQALAARKAKDAQSQK